MESGPPSFSAIFGWREPPRRRQIAEIDISKR
jgi:hypothetical protein